MSSVLIFIVGGCPLFVCMGKEDVPVFGVWQFPFKDAPDCSGGFIILKLSF